MVVVVVEVVGRGTGSDIERKMIYSKSGLLNLVMIMLNLLIMLTLLWSLLINFVDVCTVITEPDSDDNTLLCQALMFIGSTTAKPFLQCELSKLKHIFPIKLFATDHDPTL